jgi:hypothetical protein
VEEAVKDGDEKKKKAGPESAPEVATPSIVREVRASDTLSSLSFSEHTALTKFRDDKVVGFRESDRDGLQAGADLESTGMVRSELIGKPRQNEADTLHVCQILVSAINDRGAAWSSPSIVLNDSADCEASSRTKKGTLRVQVVRAVSDSSVWRQLARESAWTDARPPDRLVDELEQSIKSKLVAYGSDDRATLILALDANRLPAMMISEVRERAVERLAQTCRISGFAAVWVVGPSLESTYPLHECNSPEGSVLSGVR